MGHRECTHGTGDSWGDAAVVAVSALVIAWLVFDSAWGLL